MFPPFSWFPCSRSLSLSASLVARSFPSASPPPLDQLSFFSTPASASSSSSSFFLPPGRVSVLGAFWISPRGFVSLVLAPSPSLSPSFTRVSALWSLVFSRCSFAFLFLSSVDTSVNSFLLPPSPLASFSAPPRAPSPPACRQQPAPAVRLRRPFSLPSCLSFFRPRSPVPSPRVVRPPSVRRRPLRPGILALFPSCRRSLRHTQGPPTPTPPSRPPPLYRPARLSCSLHSIVSQKKKKTKRAREGGKRAQREGRGGSKAAAWPCCPAAVSSRVALIAAPFLFCSLSVWRVSKLRLSDCPPRAKTAGNEDEKKEGKRGSLGRPVAGAGAGGKG